MAVCIAATLHHHHSSLQHKAGVCSPAHATPHRPCAGHTTANMPALVPPAGGVAHTHTTQPSSAHSTHYIPHQTCPACPPGVLWRLRGCGAPPLHHPHSAPRAAAQPQGVHARRQRHRLRASGPLRAGPISAVPVHPAQADHQVRWLEPPQLLAAGMRPESSHVAGTDVLMR
jgi:hypothetical protein